jgi:hypothetical protein
MSTPHRFASRSRPPPPWKIALEEEDSRIYRDLAEKLKAKHSAIASILDTPVQAISLKYSAEK